MKAKTDKSTFVNLTVHLYINLNGAGSGTAESQYFPNSPNMSQFPNTELSPGEIYEHQIRYQFGIELSNT